VVRAETREISESLVKPRTDATCHLRVLIANERKGRLAQVDPIVIALRHEVIARAIDVEDLGPLLPGSDPTSP
jgi:hypothetical protein